ncbi:phosphoglycerate mutase family domain protein [Ascosphaera apis ARSEF 7405]|uniref:Phosphoglycerate mutase family domain protein n=1 Tax=Ascosphaera apis ARSEF 7405 TaxID=392613 RepID=A0A167Y652_9EURO|nr:phosphoglycerate mutase family domain protein [Ascosphaera apis ARSEF 7405]
MAKPRMIILIRHGHSEGNKNRAIHQTVPDHRVKLTPEGWRQAREAGRKLRSLLHPSDTLQFFTSPYRRTRETTEGILESLTSTDPEPSPFPRDTIKVYEEPRLREQDFGNFQPGTDEMERIWKERAAYGHFFYRIPHGESAADAYDRISGFNESLWRLFGEEDFASVCILVTHGLMSRVFLMKWYHFSVEYFEDLRNVNHCEFIVMKLNPETGKYVLQNKLRTWSELERENERKKRNECIAEADSIDESPIPPWRKWCGCQVTNCNHVYRAWHALPKRRNTQDLFEDEDFPATSSDSSSNRTNPPAQKTIDVSAPADASQTTSLGTQDPSQNKSGESTRHLSVHNPDYDQAGGRTHSKSPISPKAIANPTIPATAQHHHHQRYPSPVVEEPPEGDPAANVNPSERRSKEKEISDLSERVRRMGRDGGGSNSGVSGLDSSSASTSSSESSDRSSNGFADDEGDINGRGPLGVSHAALDQRNRRRRSRSSERIGGSSRHRQQEQEQEQGEEQDPYAYEKSHEGCIY